ncbi:unnamed protein product [Amoebophrya sp. A120]|nr:unnamed protein product [Amoebophrya sp. A120]|eukprot:GSA120T00018985001.1
MKFSSYFVLSAGAAMLNCLHAWSVHEQFYPAVIHLASDKVSLAVLYNFLFSLFVMLGWLTLKFFIGRLRDLEIEQLIDSGRGFLADTILFLVFYSPTIDQKEVATLSLMQFIVGVIFLKMFHLIAQIRVTHMFEIGAPKKSVKIKLAVLMLLLILVDIATLQRFYAASGRHSTFYTWILFESFSMAAMIVVTMLKYVLHLIDTSLEHGWPGKAAYIFYLELLGDVVSMTIFLCFMSVFFIQNPSRLPIYMMADIIQVARQLTTRLRNFRKYRCIMADFESKFRMADEEELKAAETCIICRDDLNEGSVILPCNHIFHVDCLKSWLVMQQVCPTCRAEIPIEREKLNEAYRESDKKAGRTPKQEANPSRLVQDAGDHGAGTSQEDRDEAAEDGGGDHDKKQKSSKSTGWLDTFIGKTKKKDQPVEDAPASLRKIEHGSKNTTDPAYEQTYQTSAIRSRHFREPTSEAARKQAELMRKQNAAFPHNSAGSSSSSSSSSRGPRGRPPPGKEIDTSTTSPATALFQTEQAAPAWATLRDQMAADDSTGSPQYGGPLSPSTSAALFGGDPNFYPPPGSSSSSQPEQQFLSPVKSPHGMLPDAAGGPPPPPALGSLYNYPPGTGGPVATSLPFPTHSAFAPPPAGAEHLLPPGYNIYNQRPTPATGSSALPSPGGLYPPQAGILPSPLGTPGTGVGSLLPPGSTPFGSSRPSGPFAPAFARSPSDMSGVSATSQPPFLSPNPEFHAMVEQTNSTIRQLSQMQAFWLQQMQAQQLLMMQSNPGSAVGTPVVPTGLAPSPGTTTLFPGGAAPGAGGVPTMAGVSPAPPAGLPTPGMHPGDQQVAAAGDPLLTTAGTSATASVLPPAGASGSSSLGFPSPLWPMALPPMFSPQYNSAGGQQLAPTTGMSPAPPATTTSAPSPPQMANTTIAASPPPPVEAVSSSATAVDRSSAERPRSATSPAGPAATVLESPFATAGAAPSGMTGNGQPPTPAVDTPAAANGVAPAVANGGHTAQPTGNGTTPTPSPNGHAHTGASSDTRPVPDANRPSVEQAAVAPVAPSPSGTATESPPPLRGNTDSVSSLSELRKLQEQKYREHKAGSPTSAEKRPSATNAAPKSPKSSPGAK